MEIKQIILASESKIRKRILAASGVEFSSKKSNVDEHLIQSEDPESLAFKRAEAKSKSVASREKYSLVIGCDQTLSCNKKIFHKPKNMSAAEKQLKYLSGKKHFLHSAVYLSMGSMDKVIPLPNFSFVKTSELSVRSLSSSEINNYLSCNEWQGCVGGYRIEEKGIHLFDEKLRLDHTAIMGLPILDLLSKFRELGVNILEQPKGPWNVAI